MLWVVSEIGLGVHKYKLLLAHSVSSVTEPNYTLRPAEVVLPSSAEGYSQESVYGRDFGTLKK